MRHPLTPNSQAAIFSFQNNEQYWQDAKTFKPERFLAKADSSERASSLPAFCAFGDVRPHGHAMLIYTDARAV